MEERLEDSEQQNEELTAENKDLSDKLDESVRRVKILEEDLSSAEEKLTAAEDKLKELETELTDINNNMKKMEAAEGLQAQREDELESKIRDLTEEKGDLHIRAENAERQIQVLEENIAKLEKEVEDEQTSHAETKAELEAVNAEIDDI